MISQSATSNVEQTRKAEVVANCDHRQRLKFSLVLSYAFTEHGAIMVASVLDKQIVAIVDALRLLMPPEDKPPTEPFGFRRAKKN